MILNLNNPLSPLIDALDKQNDRLGRARADYLALEAERKHLEASLIQESPGKSHAEKVNNAQCLPAWPLFQLKLARAEAVYEFEKLKFTIMEKNWMSAYLELKINNSVIIKGGSGD